MIPRYARPEMVAIWSDAHRYALWLAIELHACDAMVQQGIVPQEAAAAIRARATCDPERIAEIERTTKHDVIAFLTNVAEHVGESSRFLHQGMTSSDVLDTCLALQCTQACDLLLQDIEDVCAVLRRRAYETQYMLCMGRSHGIHGEPTTFGLKLAGFYAEFRRNATRLQHARADIATCAISGAMGTFATIDPTVEAYVAAQLGLMPEPISTQVIPRDRHAMLFATLGVIASSIERIAVEVRHLQRSEVREAEEYFSPGQKGSSAMPHKRNPVLSENLTGLARIVRGYVTPALENVALWHERDMSHSSVERMIAPDAMIVLDFALVRLRQLLEQWVLYPEHMQANMDATRGLYASQRVLLALVERGFTREDAYSLVQRNAMRAWSQRLALRTCLEEDHEISKHLPHEVLETLFDPAYYTRHVATIFRRVFEEPAAS
jgi:adenylosuccinate lyase